MPQTDNAKRPAENQSPGLSKRLLCNLGLNKTFDKNERTINFQKAWYEMIIGDSHEWYLHFRNKTFVIHMGVMYEPFMDSEDDLNICKIIFGVKDKYNRDYRTCCIELGIYMGRLFLDKDFDKKNIPGEIFTKGVRLVLKVTAFDDGKAIAKLKLLDENGICRASMSTTKYTALDWEGYIFPGAHVKFFRIV